MLKGNAHKSSKHSGPKITYYSNMSPSLDLTISLIYEY